MWGRASAVYACSMPDLPSEILHHYAAEIDEDVRIRQGIGQLEFVRTQHIVRRHLGDAPQRVADIGGATGVHSEWLLGDGHEVTLVEPVPEQVARAEDLLGGRPGFRAMIGNALELPLDDGAFDTAMLMGPLYHLTARAERLQALQEAMRVVRPGGVVVAAAISRFASLLDGLQRGFLFDPVFRKIAEDDLRTGQHRNPQLRPEWFTTAYFHHPDDLAREAADAGLSDPKVIGVEGPAGLFAELASRWDDPADRAIILGAAEAVETEPSLLGASPHLLLVARRSEVPTRRTPERSDL
jgi:SAM-dependent methyltransferase